MDEFALIPAAGAGGNAGAAVLQQNGEGVLAEHYIEPIAEHNFARKKMQSLELGMDKLRKDARQLHEIVTQQGGDMKIMVSELDLRRAIGLAFQEFELRLEDAFTDSNRKCLAMFSKREEVIEMQALIGKKVNWSEYNTVLKKLSDLRQYIDTMAESVFIGHRDALNSEFAKKADALVVEQALKAKADFSEVSDVRARLERLEVLVGQTDTRHSSTLEAMRNELTEKAKALADKQQATIMENQAGIAALQGDLTAFASRLGSAEGALGALGETARKMMEAEKALQGHQDAVLSSIASLQDRLAKADEHTLRNREDLKLLGESAEEFRETSTNKFRELSAQGENFNERLDFLMQATEMIKRKSRETNKGNTTKFEEIGEEQDKHANQLAALERQLKRQERDLRAVEHRANRADGAGGGPMRALPAPPFGQTGAGALLSTTADETSGSAGLQSVLEQLEKIAAGGHPFEQMGVQIDPMKPPLPYGGGERRGTDTDFGLPKAQAAIDSARGGTYPYPAAAPRAASYGHSPRPGPGASGAAAGASANVAALGGGGKTPRRKKP